MTSDTSRLKEVSSFEQRDAAHFGTALIFGTLCIFQFIPLLTLVILTTTRPSTPIVPTNQNQPSPATQIPKQSTKIMLIYAALSTLIIWLEPSVINLILDYAFNHPTESKSCLVPPWFWIDQTILYSSTTQKVVPVHGWASYMDLLILNGLLGLLLLFLYMKREYTRHCEVFLNLT